MGSTQLKVLRGIALFKGSNPFYSTKKTNNRNSIMKNLIELMTECKNRAFNCSFTNQKVNDYSVEIYTGYESTYKLIFYTDGHIKPKKAIKSALKYLKNLK